VKAVERQQPDGVNDFGGQISLWNFGFIGCQGNFVSTPILASIASNSAVVSLCCLSLSKSAYNRSVRARALNSGSLANSLHCKKKSLKLHDEKSKNFKNLL